MRLKQSDYPKAKVGKRETNWRSKERVRGGGEEGVGRGRRRKRREREKDGKGRNERGKWEKEKKGRKSRGEEVRERGKVAGQDASRRKLGGPEQPSSGEWGTQGRGPGDGGPASPAGHSPGGRAPAQRPRPRTPPELPAPPARAPCPSFPRSPTPTLPRVPPPALERPSELRGCGRAARSGGAKELGAQHVPSRERPRAWSAPEWPSCPRSARCGQLSPGRR